MTEKTIQQRIDEILLAEQEKIEVDVSYAEYLRIINDRKNYSTTNR